MSRRNPPAIPVDTSPDVWRRQTAAIAARSVSERQVFMAVLRHRYGDDLVLQAWPNEDLVAA